MNRHEKLVSVVIPTHNRAKLLIRAINSVLDQTFSNLEIIVVSDGSTDNTRDIVMKFENEDSRVRLIEVNPGKGGNYARNLGIKYAQGDYVAFLDDDDEWYCTKIFEQMQVFKQDADVGLVYTGCHIIYDDEKVEYLSIGNSKGDLSKKILYDGGSIGTTSTIMVKKNLLNEVGGFDPELGAMQDYELCIRLCQLTKVGVVEKELINYYNYRSNQQISSLTQKYIEATKYILNKHKLLFATLTPEQLKKKYLEDELALSNRALRNGDNKLARIYAKKAVHIKLCKKSIVYFFLSFFDYRKVLIIRSMVNKRN